MSMPLTPFHLGIAWPIWLRFKDRLHFVCISFGAAVPDLEVLVLAPFTEKMSYARGFLHSYYGAFTADLVITLIVAYLLVPPFGRWLAKRASRGGEKWHHFAGKDIGKAPVHPGWAIFSTLIGTVSHVTLDLFTHKYNPIWWPYQLDRNINWLLYGETIWSSLVFMVPLGIIVFAMLLKYWTK